MELVYLWVEEYKNIRNQGFRFSPRFECEFDGKNLTINENKDYVSIFPENINVTAIVGENGSGKSNILSLIEDITSIVKQIIYIFRIDKEVIYYSNFEFIENKDNNIKLIKFKSKMLSNISLITLKNNLDLSDIKEVDIGEHTPSRLYLLKEKSEPISKLIKTDLYFTNLKNIRNWLGKKTNNSISTSVNLRLQLLKESENNKIGIYYNELETFLVNELKLDNIRATIKPLEDTYKYSPYKLSFEHDELLHDLSDLFDKSNDLNQLKIHAIINLYLIDENSKNKLFEEYELTKSIKFDNINEIYNFLIENNKNAIHWKEFITNYEQIDSNIKLFSKSYKKLFEEMKHSIFYFHIDSKFSTGQEKMLYFFLKLFEFFDMNHCKNYLIEIDEGEVFFHPNWQKKYIALIVKFISMYFKGEKVQFLISSHSPFILSDLPKGNIIFLEKGVQKQPFKEDEQTFGANIHTLLSNGFFMSDGLIGEFAKSKIRIIQITYKYILHRHKQKSLNKKEHKKSRRFIKTQLKILWHIQAIIGEKFLQTIMKNYLQEIEEILFGNEKAIDNEIERLQNLRKSIKNAKN